MCNPLVVVFSKYCKLAWGPGPQKAGGIGLLATSKPHACTTVSANAEAELRQKHQAGPSNLQNGERGRGVGTPW